MHARAVVAVLVLVCTALVHAAGCGAPPPECAAAVSTFNDLQAQNVAVTDARYDAVAALKTNDTKADVCSKARVVATVVVDGRAQATTDAAAAATNRDAAKNAAVATCTSACERELSRCFMQDCGCGPPAPPMIVQGKRIGGGGAATCLNRRSNRPRDEACEHGCGASSVSCKQGCAQRAEALAIPTTTTTTTATAAAATTAAPEGAGKRVELRGPKPRPSVAESETSLQEQGVLKMTNEVQAMTSGLYTSQVKTRDTLKVLAVDDGGAPIRVIALARMADVVDEIDGERQTLHDELVGVELLGVKNGERWDHTRVDGKALTKEQKKELDGVTYDDDALLFPKDAVAVGDSFTPPKDVVAAVFASVGTAHVDEATFKLVSFDDSQRATLEGKLRFSVVDAKGLSQEFDGVVHLVRDVATATGVEWSFKGRFGRDIVFKEGDRGRAEGDVTWTVKTLSTRDATPEDEPPPPKAKKSSKAPKPKGSKPR